MKKQRSFKLLTKTTSIYLIFTFIAFISSAFFLIRETDKFISKDLESSYGRYEHRLKRYIAEGKPIDRLHTDVQQLPGDAASISQMSPVYSDTVIYNSGVDEMQRFRKKTIFFRVHDAGYRAILLLPVGDFLKLRDDIFGSLIPAFIFLAMGIVLFNYLLSGYFFRPFNRILDIMKTYKVGRGSGIKKIKTNTSEFIRMQDLFHQMIERIEYDYCNLKEYTENMAHEMQTPLTVIFNKTENLIADESVMRKNADNVKIIYEETNYLSKMGNSLNLLTKIENGEFSNAIRIETRPVIEKQVAAVEELARLKSLTIDAELSPEHQIVIDPFLLDIILKNLIRNAISYGTGEGPIRIRTAAGEFTITNYGPPLDVPEEKIFQRFYRNHNSKTSLGLGLSLVKKICELNGLAIHYSYREGQHVFRIKEAV